MKYRYDLVECCLADIGCSIQLLSCESFLAETDERENKLDRDWIQLLCPKINHSLKEWLQLKVVKVIEVGFEMLHKFIVV